MQSDLVAKLARLSLPLVLVVGGLPLAWAGEPSRASDRSLPELIEEYQADRETVDRFFNLPASAADLARARQVRDRWLTVLRPLDFSRLDDSARLDFLLLKNHLERSLDDLGRQEKRLTETDPLLPFRGVIQELETARWHAAPLDAQAVASRLDALARQVRQIRDRVEKQAKQKPEEAKPQPGRKPAETAPSLTLSPALALRAAGAVKGLQDTLKTWYGFYAGYRPEFDWWVKKPYEEARKQLDEYAKFLREEIARQKGKDDDSLVGDPIGPEAIAAGIRFEFLPYTADELIAIGQRELAWCEGEMKVASRQMGLGEDWKAALGKVKADFAPPGHQDELIAGIAREATEFVRKRNLVRVPSLCEEAWRLSMISPEGIKTVPYASYGGQEMNVAYARDDMSQEEKLMVMRGNNRHFMRLVTPHELIPGHHLQNYEAARHHTYRQLFWTPFYVEGWALYWELRLWDLGWARTPEDRIGMLFWRMTRAARVIVSLRYHLGQMKPAEMVDFLIDRVGHERLGATSEVRRFVRASPLYQAGYLLGGLQFDALHKELVGSGKMTEEQFHDRVLQENAMPVELLRARLLGLPLRRDMTPAWRFADRAMGR